MSYAARLTLHSGAPWSFSWLTWTHEKKQWNTSKAVSCVWVTRRKGNDDNMKSFSSLTNMCFSMKSTQVTQASDFWVVISTLETHVFKRTWIQFSWHRSTRLWHLVECIAWWIVIRHENGSGVKKVRMIWPLWGGLGNKMLTISYLKASIWCILTDKIKQHYETVWMRNKVCIYLYMVTLCYIRNETDNFSHEERNRSTLIAQSQECKEQT